MKTDSRIQATRISKNRLTGLSDEDISDEWDGFNPEASGWAQECKQVIPRIEEDEHFLLRRLEKKMDKLADSIDAQDGSKRGTESTSALIGT